MSKREEIKEIISEIEIPAGFLGNLRDLADKDKINLATDKILALAPFSKLERVREYCEKTIYIRKERLKIKREILSLISENEKAFDVREWLKEKGIERSVSGTPYEETYEFNSKAGHKIKILFSFAPIHKDVYIYRNGNIAFSGDYPTSLYFWEMLLSSSNIQL